MPQRNQIGSQRKRYRAGATVERSRDVDHVDLHQRLLHGGRQTVERERSAREHVEPWVQAAVAGKHDADRRARGQAKTGRA